MRHIVLLALTMIAAAVAADGLTPGWARARAFGRQMRPGPSVVPAARPDTDIVVGFPDSNEVRTISGTYSHEGRIIVLNNGTRVSAGIYVIRLATPEAQATRKLVLTL